MKIKKNVSKEAHLNSRPIYNDFVDQVPHLQCETVTVPNSVNSVAQPLFSGESIKFTCNDGFHVTVLVTVQELTCLPPKKWSYPARPCKGKQ